MNAKPEWTAQLNDFTRDDLIIIDAALAGLYGMESRETGYTVYSDQAAMAVRRIARRHGLAPIDAHEVNPADSCMYKLTTFSRNALGEEYSLTWDARFRNMRAAIERGEDLLKDNREGFGCVIDYEVTLI